MEVLIVGCERSGTKMFASKLSKELDCEFVLENKHTIATFKYQQELDRWVRYSNQLAPINNTNTHEKHTLNTEINIEFLKWVKETWRNVKIYYVLRDGRDVVSSIMNKIWGYSQTRGKYKIGFEEACDQWNTVIDTTLDWAHNNAEIIKYEDSCNIVSTPLQEELHSLATTRLYENLTKTGYL